MRSPRQQVYSHRDCSLRTCCIRPLYHQVIVRSNLRFAEGYLASRTSAPSLWVEIVGRYRNDPQKLQHAQALKNFLRYLEDIFVRHQLANELGFKDLVSSDMPLELYEDWRKREGSS